MHALDRVNIMTHTSDARQDRPHLIRPLKALEIYELNLPKARFSLFKVRSQDKFDSVRLVHLARGTKSRMVEIILELRFNLSLVQNYSRLLFGKRGV